MEERLMFVKVKGHYGLGSTVDYLINTKLITAINIQKKAVWFTDVNLYFAVTEGFEKLLEAIENEE